MVPVDVIFGESPVHRIERYRLRGHTASPAGDPTTSPLGKGATSDIDVSVAV